ncbi:ankyrin-1-like isoform X3 [Ostrea edulis]|uniref:ankyrin-1-like isoform X3 n=1 Tax=Ostrea edulis TaxID=37623 RepID=UPI0024AFBA3F|nr:ankyrin-1-like isoform X3 [Ostrea edulis]
MAKSSQFGNSRKCSLIGVMGVTYALILVLLSAKTHGYSYRFNVYSVSECPTNATTFQRASDRMNCSGTSRYLCAPDNALSNLIEFCTDHPRVSLYGPDNCVRLEGTGDLNHYRCSNTFLYGCPDKPYYDNEIYTNPACLTINTAFHCFVAERDCPKGLPITTETVTEKNVNVTTKIHKKVNDFNVAIIIVTASLISCIALVVLILLLYLKRKKKKGFKRRTVIDKADLRRYLSKEYVTVYHARCIILGCGGAGKSTLLSRLQDKPYKEIKNIERTQGIDVHVNIFEVLEETIQRASHKRKETPEMPNIVFSEKDVTGHVEDDICRYQRTRNTADDEINDSEENTTLMRSIDNCRDAEASFRRKKDDNSVVHSMDQRQESTTVDIQDNEAGTGGNVKKNEHVDTKEEDKENVVKEIVDAITHLVKEKPGKPRITFLDFAGQGDYYAFHQIYLSPKTFYILVVDMSKNFDDKNELDERSGSRFTSWKYKDYYKFWLKSIDSFSDTRTPVIVVGTHAEGKTPKIKQEAENSDTTRTFIANKEVTDEGSTSWRDILDACLDGNTESFFFHLQNAFDDRKHLLKKVDRDGWNALHFAAKGGNLKIFEALLSKDLNIFQKTNDGMTILHIAAQNAQYNICQNVLENSNFKPVLKETSSQGKNACHYAAEGGCIKVLKLLAANGIDVTATTNDKQNIFHIACIYDKLDMCQYIASNHDSLIRRECNEKWNATLFAAKVGSTNILKFLHMRGFSFVHKSESDRNVLHIACDNGHLDSCKYITEVCPALLNDVDHKGRHAGHFAARNGNIEIMKYLVSQNAEVTKNTNTGMNILHMACLHEHIGMCKYLLENFTDLNLKKTERGWTTVHFLAGKGKNKGNEIELFGMITKDNVEINALTKKGNSVLTLAIKHNLHEFCEFLFQNHPHLLEIPNAIHPLSIEIKDGKMASMVAKYMKERTSAD